MNKLIDFDKIIQNLLSIPRSKNDTGQALLAYIKNLCEKEGYEYNEDEFANLLIIKEASEEFLDIEPIFLHARASYEYEEYRVLEANKSEYKIDYYKNSNKFLSDTMSIGSNAHQGIAMIIAILTNKDLKHPKIEIIISSNNNSIEPSISKFDVNQLESQRGISLIARNDDEIIVSSELDFKIRIDQQILVKRIKAEKLYVAINRNDMILLKDLDKYIHGLASLDFYTNYINLEIVSDDIELVKKQILLNADKWSINPKEILMEDLEVEVSNVYNLDQVSMIYRDYLNINYKYHTELTLNHCGLIEMEFSPKDSRTYNSLWKVEYEIAKFANDNNYNYELIKKVPEASYDPFSQIKDLLKMTHQKLYKKNMELVGLNEASEMGYFTKIHYLDIIGMGPNCEFNGMECIDLESLDKTYTILMQLLESLNKEMPLNYLDLRQIINEFDPINLIFLESPDEGAPLDEYDVETLRIMRYLHSSMTKEEIMKLVDDVFDYFFNGDDILKIVYQREEEDLEEVADKIINLHKEHQSNLD